LPRPNVIAKLFYIKCRCRRDDFHPKESGKQRTMMGNIFKYGDYLIIPRGIIYQIDFDSQENHCFMSNLCSIYTPKRYKNGLDNIRAFSFCERDFILPNELETNDEKGDF
jgi:homogentisate 1,2-dioxygenase